ncbi:hypothetical protein FJZ26_03270 [Candidatus Parvarchaeota archaeon]|nr:hypothetical protein [Candidatus Parvarchaeota archaeon]
MGIFVPTMAANSSLQRLYSFYARNQAIIAKRKSLFERLEANNLEFKAGKSAFIEKIKLPLARQEAKSLAKEAEKTLSLKTLAMPDTWRTELSVASKAVLASIGGGLAELSQHVGNLEMLLRGSNNSLPTPVQTAESPFRDLFSALGLLFTLPYAAAVIAINYPGSFVKDLLKFFKGTAAYLGGGIRIIIKNGPSLGDYYANICDSMALARTKAMSRLTGLLRDADFENFYAFLDGHSESGLLVGKLLIKQDVFNREVMLRILSEMLSGNRDYKSSAKLVAAYYLISGKFNKGRSFDPIPDLAVFMAPLGFLLVNSNSTVVRESVASKLHNAQMGGAALGPIMLQIAMAAGDDNRNTAYFAANTLEKEAAKEGLGREVELLAEIHLGFLRLGKQNGDNNEIKKYLTGALVYSSLRSNRPEKTAALLSDSDEDVRNSALAALGRALLFVGDSVKLAAAVQLCKLAENKVNLSSVEAALIVAVDGKHPEIAPIAKLALFNHYLNRNMLWNAARLYYNETYS